MVFSMLIVIDIYDDVCFGFLRHPGISHTTHRASTLSISSPRLFKSKATAMCLPSSDLVGPGAIGAAPPDIHLNKRGWPPSVSPQSYSGNDATRHLRQVLYVHIEMARSRA